MTKPVVTLSIPERSVEWLRTGQFDRSSLADPAVSGLRTGAGSGPMNEEPKGGARRRAGTDDWSGLPGEALFHDFLPFSQHVRPHSSWAALGTAIILALPALQAEAADVVTVESLLGRMTDTRWLATPPQAGERTVQFSSYDRASRLVDGKIVNPFANGDRGHYLRVEGEGKDREWVLAEAQGPGYVSRIWSANPDGELRIYVDGSKTPALAAPFAAITKGEVKPFEAPFGHDASRGRNLYFPVPVREVDQDQHDQGRPVLPGERDNVARGDEG